MVKVKSRPSNASNSSSENYSGKHNPKDGLFDEPPATKKFFYY